ncbi:MAG: D-alanyl-D-alanine carboxypeptidase/D-alanyl-D-alanine-endopeptidase [Bacteroidetes bacterium]|nr:D-alanyl-D-alanine carboxypeptidase/D-alanyl-D-alanine-endopeptidase [Bacteroidota bacterium]MBK8488191.1 D-alanyl-D-alanine carboxypeptidase/D-alanyl-D-alanine-endopeptidase [Bacteroidota bacterium]
MQFTFKIFLITFFASIFANDIYAQTKIQGLQSIENYVSTLSKDADLLNASWGFCLMDPVNGSVLSSFDKERSLIPASGVKAITTLTAMELLGANYTYKTKLEYDGELSNGVLTGNLYISGSGDPTLGSNRMKGYNRYDTLLLNWAAIIQQYGIKEIQGFVIADTRVFDDEFVTGSWNWDDIGQYYGSGANGLNFFENIYTLYYSSEKKSTKIDSVFPKINALEFENQVIAGGSGNNAYIFGGPDSYKKTITGTIPVGVKRYEVKGAMPDPAKFAADEFVKVLELKGVKVKNGAYVLYQMTPITKFGNAKRETIYTHTSANLLEIITETNSKSINLYAESILKTIGKEKLLLGSRNAGIKATRDFWTTAGYSLRGFNMEDGSGLSRLNVMTTYQMASFMMYATKRSYFSDYKKSMAVAGVSGTLKSMASGTAAQGKIFAKSGTMSKVRSYTGFVEGKSGKIYVFSVIVNNYTCSSTELKSKLEKLMILMAGLE